MPMRIGDGIRGEIRMRMTNDRIAAHVTALAVLAVVLFALNLNLVFPEPEHIDLNSYLGSRKVDLNTTVTIVEFSDFKCPYCGLAAELMDKIRKTYGDGVEVEFRHFPLHDGSMLAAQAAECARDQERFWEYHDLLFENLGAVSENDLTGFAKEAGLDAEEFGACLDSGESDPTITEDMALGRSMGVRATPTFFIGDQMVVGIRPISEIQQIIEEEAAR